MQVSEKTFTDDAECVRYIISTNIHRRHLTDEQRDQIGARLVTMQQGGDRANPQNAGLVGVTAAAAMVQSTPARIERARLLAQTPRLGVGHMADLIGAVAEDVEARGVQGGQGGQGYFH